MPFCIFSLKLTLMKEKTWQDIHTDLKAKIYHPVYLLMGEEPFFIDVISDAIEKKVLTDEEKEFNQTILYGRDTDVPTIVSVAKRYPMMSNHQVVIIKEAQNVKDIELLEPYVKNPLKSTILVLCYKYKTYDKRKSFYKSVVAHGVVLDSKKLYDNKMPEWISNYVKPKGFKIGDRAAQLIADHLGNDLGKVVNELKKVFISLPKGGEITDKLIEQNIGISKDFNIFELQNALTAKNTFKAFQIAKYFGENPKSNPMPVTLALLYTYFSRILQYHYIKDKSQGDLASELKVAPFLVKDITAAANKYPVAKLISIFSFLREYDLKSKGVDSSGTDDGELLKELIYKILN
jgi:DNA polymerase III subunit delta